MKFGDNSVMALGVVLWDGVTRPEDTKDEKTGETYKKYSLSVAILKTAAEIQELDTIARAELANGQFKGQWKNGMNWPINEIAPTDYEGRLPSHMKINTISYRPVQVFDQNKQELSFMQYQNLLYPGAMVWVLVSPRSYDAKGNKGIGFWLGGVMIADATTPRLPVGQGVDPSKAFGALPGGGPAPGGPGMPPAANGPAGMPPAGPGAPGMAGPAGPAAAAPLAGPTYTMTALAGAYTREQYLGCGQGWTDELLVQKGYMTIAQPAAPAAGPGMAGPAGPGAPGGVAPAHDFVNGPGAPGGPGAGYGPGAPAGPGGLGGPVAPAPARQMTEKAGGWTYEQFMATGQWTDDLLRQNGMML